MGELYNPYPKLPKNIRQIGERDQIVKLYMEDYVNTYLKRLYPVGAQDLRVGVLLGTTEVQDGTPYIFIDGAMEMEDVTEDGEKVVFTENAWRKAYQCMEEMFPKRTVQGWFLCGAQGCQLSPLNYWKQHGQYFSEKNQLMYLNSGLEGEEAIYITSEDGFYKLRGHSIYYERNQMMQDYMILRKDAKRVESGGSDGIIRDFRQRMDERRNEVQTRKNTVGVLSGLCSVLSVVVLAGGIVMFNNFHKMQEMESVLASVMPDGIVSWNKDGGIDSSDQVVIEELEGQVYPTQAETESLIERETMSPVQSTEIEIPPTVHQETVEETTVPTFEEADQETLAVGQAMAEMSTYTVGDGETLYGICYKLYQDLENLDKICELNGLSDVNHITAGQTLILP